MRIIAVTNRNLRTESETGRFRQDLFYRLSVFPMELPPLRKRVEDIPLLADHFLDRLARQLGRARPRLSLANVQELQRYAWPGNVRELQHVLERACIVSTDGKLRFDFPKKCKNNVNSQLPLPSNTHSYRYGTKRTGGKQSSLVVECCERKDLWENGAAALLAVKPTTLASRMKAQGITSASRGVT